MNITKNNIKEGGKENRTTLFAWFQFHFYFLGPGLLLTGQFWPTWQKVCGGWNHAHPLLASSCLATVAIFFRKARAAIPGMLIHSSRSVCVRAAIMGLNLCWEANCPGELFTLQSPTRGKNKKIKRRERSKSLKFSSLLMRVASQTRCCISIAFSFRQSVSQLAYLAVGNICCCFPLSPCTRRGKGFCSDEFRPVSSRRAM